MARLRNSAPKCCALLLACCALSAAAHAQNLLDNGDFERADGTLPAAWSLYVAPQEGAFGRLEPLEEGTAVLLHTPLPYARDPMNNWSQNITGNHAGKKLRLNARIRTLEAEGAGILAQCWNTARRTVLLAHGTLDSPLHGTQDWTPVETTFTVPQNTDFITIRCVLKGTGSAWFDDLSLEVVEQPRAVPAAPSPAAPAPASVGAAPEPPQQDAQPPTATAAPAAAPAPTATLPSATPPAADTARNEALLRQLAEIEQLERALKSLRGQNSVILDDLSGVSTENAALREQLRGMQAELEALKSLVELDQPPAQPDPPLVPHGWERRLR